MSTDYKYIRFFKDLGINDVPLVGGKPASLGEMYRELTKQGVRVPNGFGITADAYRYMLDKANAWEDLHHALDGVELALDDLPPGAKRRPDDELSLPLVCAGKHRRVSALAVI